MLGMCIDGDLWPYHHQLAHFVTVMWQDQSPSLCPAVRVCEKVVARKVWFVDVFQKFLFSEAHVYQELLTTTGVSAGISSKGKNS